MNTCKYEKYRKMASYDNGETWQALDEYQRGELIEYDSVDCGGEHVTYYRWVDIPLAEDYYCSGTTKYYKQKKQKSTDEVNWSDVVPPEYRMGFSAESQSSDCGYAERTTSGTPYCTGVDKYIDVYSQVSDDSGSTWTTTATTPTLLEHNSEDCGYVPPAHDYSQDYLTFRALDDCSFRIMNVSGGAAYSLDSGTTWVSSYGRVSVPSGQTIMWKGTLRNECPLGYTQFGTSTGAFEAYGNVMSLMYGDDFIGKTSFNSYKFYDLFRGCTGLTSAENLVLPATTLASSCYGQMFYGCTSLTTAPTILPATTLADWCYGTMFQGCTSLTTAPQLPATALATYCYYGMFCGCTSLTTAPDLFAAVLAEHGYQSMFEDCTSLSAVTCLATTNMNANFGTYGWLSNVAPEGVFTCVSSTEWKIGFGGIPSGWTINYEKTKQPYLSFKAKENGTFRFTTSIKYSLDSGDTWTTLSANTDSPTVLSGERIMWKNYHSSTGTFSSNGTFSSTGAFEVYGNPMSILYGVYFENQTSIASYNTAFGYLFSGCTKLQNAENMSLPATTLSNKCYIGMFQGCTSLTKVPKILSATTLSTRCYENMFQGCTSLTTAPELSATTLASGCCQGMFSGCTSLTTAPTLLATTLANWCYYDMFASCHSLTTAPELSATALADRCYYQMFASCSSLTSTQSVLQATSLPTRCYENMFRGCTSLTTAPELSATTLASSCCQGMFSGCTSLTTAPSVLPATTLANWCYYDMFASCHSLTTAPELPATTLKEGCYSQMFQGCTSLTTALELPATTLASYCYSSMFQNCTSLTSVASDLLPATTLASSCYSGMFFGCTNLTTAPTLPATTLVDWCYSNMFMGCSSLSAITCLATNISAEYCTYNWVNGAGGFDGTFTKATSMTGWTSGEDGVPIGWTVQDYT